MPTSDDDPEDQAERRRVSGLLQESLLGMRGSGPKFVNVDRAQLSTRKIFAVFQTRPGGTHNAFASLE